VNKKALAHWGAVAPKGKICLVYLLSLLITSISEMFRTITGVRIASIISEILFAIQHCGLCSGVSILCLSVTVHVAAVGWVGTMTTGPRCVTLTEP